MKILLLFSSILFSPLLWAQEASELIDKVREKLDKVNDYRAEGKMTIDVSFIDAPPSKVAVYYKKPDRFKVKKDGGISILPKGGVSINISSLLANQEYDIVAGKDADISGTKVKVIKLLPREENSDVVLTTLYIEEAKLLVRRAAVTTKESGSYEIDLSYGKYSDWGLPDQVVFSFNTKDYKLPKGITFEYESGEKKPPASNKNKKGKVTLAYSKYTINKGVDDKEFK